MKFRQLSISYRGSDNSGSVTLHLTTEACDEC